MRYSELLIPNYVYCFTCSFAGIHAPPPDLVETGGAQEILETGIKVVDLLAPYAKGGKIGETR